MRRIALRLEGVGLAFPMQRRLVGRKHWALSHVDLELHHGDKLGVLGGNGAGKSTLLRVLCGAMVPDRGRVHRDHGSVQLLSLNLGFVPHLTGRDNAILSGLLQGLDRRTVEKRLDAIRQFSGLGEFFEQPISTYSSGMTSRLGFSVAMQLEPDVLLIDEVLSVGDAEFRERSGKALAERFSGRHTVVVVSHDEATLVRLCDRLLWLDHGRSVMIGPTDEVLRHYGAHDPSAAPASQLA